MPFGLELLAQAGRPAGWDGGGQSPFGGRGSAPVLRVKQPGRHAIADGQLRQHVFGQPDRFYPSSTQHFLFGRWVGAHFDRSLWIEATFYIGAAALALAVFAWVKRSGSAHTGLLKISLVIIVIAFILALGTDFHWNNQRVEVPVPAVLQNVIHREAVPIPLPAYLLFRFLPFYAKMRALMRMGLFVLIFTTLMAGLGAAALFKIAGPKKTFPLAAPGHCPGLV